MKARTRQVATDGADLTQAVLDVLLALTELAPHLQPDGGHIARLSPMTELAYQQAERQRCGTSKNSNNPSPSPTESAPPPTPSTA